MSKANDRYRFRSIQTFFWNDSKVVQHFTATDCYLYLYLLTTPHGNLSGCFEVAMNDISHETKLKTDQINKSLQHLEELNVIRCDPSTNEILLLNFHKYNWANSHTTIAGIMEVAKHINSEPLKEYVICLCEKRDTPSIPHRYPIDTTCDSTITNTETITDSLSDSLLERTKKKTIKKLYGEYKHVMLSDDQLDKLKTEFPENWEQKIKALDEYCETSGKTYKNYYLVIKKWKDYSNNTTESNKSRTYEKEDLKWW